VLEQIAQDTAAMLGDIRGELRLLRGEQQGEMQQLRGEMQQLRGEIQQLRAQQHEDFRWLLRLLISGFVGVLALSGAIGAPALWLLVRVAVKAGALG
jgi:hypothetical protein